MPNINDYLDWRGDIPLTAMPLNEVDNMILSRFSYMPFEKIKVKKVETVESLMKKITELDPKSYNIAGDVPLSQKLLTSERFKNLKVTDYFKDNDTEAEKQFSAITLHLPNNEIYISFCGTDNTIVGWKEDFNLSFMEYIPAQIDGVNYLKEIAKKYNGKIRLGGHSKGGNIAVYAGAFCGKRIQNRIIEVTNHDGPGFDESVIEKEEYKRILTRIRTYIPQSSIIGRLLEHREKYKVVFSTEKGVMQHDIYSWEVKGTKMIKEEKVTNGSEFINNTLSSWVKSVTPKERKHFITIIYSLIEKTDAKTCTEFAQSKLKNINKILKEYKNIDKEDKQMISQIMKLLVVSAKDSLKSNYT